MVIANDLYLVMSTIAVVHETPESKKVSPKDLEQILNPPLAISASLEGQVIVSQRDQIEVVLANVKTNVRDMSGRPDFSRSKIGKVVVFFVTRFEMRVSSYGLNFLVKVPCANPNEWLIENVISSKISEKTGKPVIGGAAVVSLESEKKTWNIKLEKAEDAVILVDFNASEQTDRLPDDDALRGELDHQWASLVRFLSDLGL